MNRIDQTRAIALFGRVDAGFTKLCEQAEEQIGEVGWAALWQSVGREVVARFKSPAKVDLAPVAELLEYLALHGEQAVLDAVCIDCIEPLVERAAKDTQVKESIFEHLGARCSAYVQAWGVANDKL